MRKRWNLEELEFIKTHYSNKDAQYCADALGRTSSSVHHKAERLGIRKFGQEIDMQLFLDIQNHYIVYFLGLLWADGYISLTQKSIGLTLTKTDMDEVEHILNSFGRWATFIKIPKNQNHKIISIKRINHIPLFNFLRDHDYSIKGQVSPQKILNKIPKHLHNYFWRGFFDGDGCIFIHTQNNYNHGAITFAGSFDLDWTDLENYLLSLNIKFKVSRVISRKGHKCSKLVISNKTGIRLLGTHIFENVNSNIGFSRKYKKYTQFLCKETLLQNSNGF